MVVCVELNCSSVPIFDIAQRVVTVVLRLYYPPMAEKGIEEAEKGEEAEDRELPDGIQDRVLATSGLAKSHTSSHALTAVYDHDAKQLGIIANADPALQNVKPTITRVLRPKPLGPSNQ